MKIIKNITTQDIVGLLGHHAAIAIFQGEAEAGPRALGNRSIVFDPRLPHGQSYINRLKKRESWRPFAGTILKEYADEWFDMQGMEDSPWMSYAVSIKNESDAGLIPAIMHQDNTCRIQTLEREQNPVFYDLINEFWESCDGHFPPILGNTSFNLAGEPLVHTKDDAIRTLENSDLEYLWLPEEEELIVIFNNNQ
jgi:carbamoyltransferase